MDYFVVCFLPTSTTTMGYVFVLLSKALNIQKIINTYLQLDQYLLSWSIGRSLFNGGLVINGFFSGGKKFL